MKDNVCVCLGRVAIGCPDAVAPRLASFLRDWCKFARALRDDDERDHAFRGIAAAARLNPHAVLPDLAVFCHAACSFDPARFAADLREELRCILDGCRRHLGDAWPAYFAQFPDDLRGRMGALYAIA